MSNYPVEPASKPQALTKEALKAIRHEQVQGVSRRELLRGSLAAGMGLWLLEVTAGTVGFLWPNLAGKVGGEVRIGTLDDVKSANATLPVDEGFPVYVSNAKAFVMLVDPSQQRHLGRLADGGRIDVDRTHHATRTLGQSDCSRRTATLPGRLGSHRGRGGESGRREIGGVGETGGLAVDHPDAGTRTAASGQFLDAAVVESDAHPAPVGGVDLGELGPGAQGHSERAGEDVVVEKVESGHAARLVSVRLGLSVAAPARDDDRPRR